MDQKVINAVTEYLQEKLGGCLITVPSAHGREVQLIEVLCDENKLVLKIRKALLEDLNPADVDEVVKNMDLATRLRAKKCLIVQDQNNAVIC